MIPESEWRWYGVAAHFICGDRCRFHLATEIGGYLISTVGELLLKDKDIELERIGTGLYESMVFKTDGKRCEWPECGCGLPEPMSYEEIAVMHCDTRGEAQKNHMKLCNEYARAK